MTRVDINGHGLREREIDYAKPPGVRRILVLGDSFVEATEVAVEEAFPRRLEVHLSAAGGAPTEVINAGAVGYGTGQEYLLLIHEGLRYRPDVVVLLFFAGNDLSDNSAELDYPPVRPIKPYFTVDAGGALQPPRFARPDLAGRLPGPLRQGLRRASLLFSKLDPDELGRVPGDPDYVRTILSAYAAAPAPAVEDAWRVTEALLRAARDRAAGAGARFVLAYVPAPWEVDPPFWERMRWYFALPADGWDLAAPNRRLAAIAARHGLAYVDLRPDLAHAVAAGRRPYYALDGHWTAGGHDIAARAVVRSGLVGDR